MRGLFCVRSLDYLLCLPVLTLGRGHPRRGATRKTRLEHKQR